MYFDVFTIGGLFRFSQTDPETNPKEPLVANPGGDPATATDPANGTTGDNNASYGGPAYLEQGWDHETRMEWWFTSQGSRVLPL